MGRLLVLIFTSASPQELPTHVVARVALPCGEEATREFLVDEETPIQLCGRRLTVAFGCSSSCDGVVHDAKGTTQARLRRSDSGDWSSSNSVDLQFEVIGENRLPRVESPVHISVATLGDSQRLQVLLEPRTEWVVPLTGCYQLPKLKFRGSRDKLWLSIDGREERLRPGESRLFYDACHRRLSVALVP